MSATSDVLAIKYRPKRFDDLIGQTTIAQTLSLALDSKRLSHAYLLSGLRGSGKTSTARIFAKSLVCEQGPTSHPCETCSHCQMANENRHIDVIEMDAASSRKIDDIRDLIEQTKYRPNSAQFKIFIIDEVHMLTKEAFNALLKTLEEPPAYVKFILATTDPLKLPATILSRTQHFRFKRISDNDIANHLEHILHLEKIEFEPTSLPILARSGNGSLRDTLTLLDQAIIYSKNFIDVSTVTDMLGLIDPKFMHDIFATIFAKDTPKLLEYIQQLHDYETEMIIDEIIAFLKERLFLQDYPHFSTLLIERFFRICAESKSLISINADGSFVLTLMLFKMIEALKLKDIDDMIAVLENDVAQNPMPQVQDVTPTFAPTEALPESSPVEVPTPAPTPQPQIDPNVEMFKKLQAKIADRNATLGENFKDAVSLVSLEETTLTLDFCAPEEVLKNLRSYYKEILVPFILDTFGENTAIKIQSTPYEKKNPEPQVATPTEPPVEQTPPEKVEEDPNGSGSCVVGCAEDAPKNESPELDRDAILKEPLVQKAIELFGNKITIQNKI